MKDSYLSVFLIFLKFGLNAWGGPVAQIAMIEQELVERRHWVTSDKFKRTLAVYQALPGPEAHELCVYFGMVRRGRLGGFLAGLGFMLPGLVLMLLMAWAYTTFGAAALLPLFVGIAPAVTALMVKALHHLGGKTLSRRPLFVMATASAIMTLGNVHFLAVFVVAVITQALLTRRSETLAYGVLAMLGILAICASFYFSAPAMNIGGTQYLFVEGLKAGLLSFGGAYTAIPFLQDSMVGTYPAITMESFLDGIGLSNVIPAPLVIFGTFLGYLAGGLGGALLITAGIFLPAFSFTLFGHRYLEKLIENRALHGMLDASAAAVIGLLFVTVLEVGFDTLAGFLPIVIFILALAGLYLLRGKWVVPAIILSCGSLGYLLSQIL